MKNEIAVLKVKSVKCSWLLVILIGNRKVMSSQSSEPTNWRIPATAPLAFKVLSMKSELCLGVLLHTCLWTI